MRPEVERRRGTSTAVMAACVTLLAGLLILIGCERQGEVIAPEETRAPVEVRASVDRAVATTGDLITFRVEVDYDTSWEVQIPEPGSEIAGFRIVDIRTDEPREVEGRVIEGRYYQLRADLVGSYVLPPVTVAYRPSPAEESEMGAESESAGPWSEARTSEIFVEVESVLPADGQATDIRDLKPLRDVRRRPPWMWIGLGALAVILLVLAAVWWMRRLRRRLSQVPPRPAHELAFEALAALRATDFEDSEAVRRFYFGISEAVRAYVEGRFGFNATDLTTEEIREWLRLGEGPDATQGGQLEQFLMDTDQVKFAHREPTEQDIESTYERALGFVEATREPDEPLEEAA